MCYVNEKASKAIEIAHANGYRVVVWSDTNSSSYEPQVFVREFYANGTKGKFRKLTGRNIEKLAAQLRQFIADGCTIAYSNAAAMPFAL